jgi:hypothetical protein
MRKFVPAPGMGFFLKLRSQEMVQLYSIAAKMAEQDEGKDLSNPKFLTLLMKAFVQNRTEIQWSQIF